jgi:hypothetical protein
LTELILLLLEQFLLQSQQFLQMFELLLRLLVQSQR